MKLISSNRGKRFIINSHEPYCGFYDVKIKVYYSAVSSGTESHNISSTKLNSTINKNNIIKLFLLIKKFELLNIFYKIFKFRKTYSPIGYSLVGEIVEIGGGVKKELKIGDKVHAGGQYAIHSNYVSVPNNFIFKLKQKIDIERYAAATIASVSVHSIKHSMSFIKVKPERSLVIGGGIIGFFCCLYLESIGIEVFFDDKQKKTICDDRFKRFNKNDVLFFDLIYVCTNSSDGINEFFNFLNYKGVVTIVGETDINFDRSLLEDKYAILAFCKSFGFGRGDLSYEYGIVNNFDSTSTNFRNNINDSIDLLRDDKKINNSINVISIQDQLAKDKINIYKWI